MKSTSYTRISATVKLHLEYNQMTVGELSNILRHWQALLRVAWMEVYESEHDHDAPKPRILISAASTDNSFDLISEYAIPTVMHSAAVFGPLINWPRQAITVYNFIKAKLQETKEARFNQNYDRVYLRVGDREIDAPVHALQDTTAGSRIENLLAIMVSGDVDMDIEFDDHFDDHME